ncbi:MAG: endoribonuclease YicC domain-containing protein, partial [Ferruginibacter sp.]
SKGKKLSFILQEIGREINTTGSKAYDSTIQKCVVLMKDELEKAKEELQKSKEELKKAKKTTSV